MVSQHNPNGPLVSCLLKGEQYNTYMWWVACFAYRLIDHSTAMREVMPILALDIEFELGINLHPVDVHIYAHIG